VTSQVYFLFRGGGVNFLSDLAETNFMLLGVTFATTGVAPLFVDPCFSLPNVLAEGDAGVPLREDLT